MRIDRGSGVGGWLGLVGVGWGWMSERLSGCTSFHLREVDPMKHFSRAVDESRRIADRKPGPSVFLPAQPQSYHESRAEGARR